MCILLKLNYAKFGVSDLLFFQSYQRKTFPLCKGRVNYCSGSSKPTQITTIEDGDKKKLGRCFIQQKAGSASAS